MKAYLLIHISPLPLWILGFGAAGDEKITTCRYSRRHGPNKTLLLSEEGIFLNNDNY